MGKLKDIFYKISSQVKDTFSKFPITIILVYILTIVYVLLWDTDFSYDILEHILFIGVLTTIGTLLVESNKERITKNIKYTGIGISIIIAILFDRLLEVSVGDSIIVEKYLLAYILSTILLIIYSFIKNSEVEFKEYILKVFSSVFKFSIVYIILNIGFLLLSLAFIELILDGEGWSLVSRALILLLGLFYIPVSIHSFTEMKVEVSKFIKSLIIYVLLPLVVMATVIIYMYLIKIAINGELLRQSIFGILSLIFVFLYPICIMTRNYAEESKTLDIISKSMMYLYIPFIILEINAIVIRTSTYGLTLNRYFAYIFLIIQIIFIILTLYKNSKYLKEILKIGVILVIITLLTPLNGERLSNLSQKKVLDIYAESDMELKEYSKEEQLRIVSAYEYLKFEDDKYMSDLSSNEKEELNNFYFNNSYDSFNQNYYKYQIINHTNELDGLDISNYSKIYDLDINYIDKYKYFTGNVGSIRVKLNLEDYLEDIIEADENNMSLEFFKDNAIIEVESEGIDIYITYIYIEYNENHDIDYCTLEGYALEK